MATETSLVTEVILREGNEAELLLLLLMLLLSHFSHVQLRVIP